jgi:CCR4-NOT transcription complex subunit 1
VKQVLVLQNLVEARAGGHRGVNEDREFDAPPDLSWTECSFSSTTLPSNVEKKAQELRDMLDPQYFGWLGHFLVVKRISTQANFHSSICLSLTISEYGKVS